jgi:hypothetical protein
MEAISPQKESWEAKGDTESSEDGMPVWARQSRQCRSILYALMSIDIDP